MMHWMLPTTTHSLQILGLVIQNPRQSLSLTQSGKATGPKQLDVRKLVFGSIISVRGVRGFRFVVDCGNLTKPALVGSIRVFDKFLSDGIHFVTDNSKGVDDLSYM